MRLGAAIAGALRLNADRNQSRIALSATNFLSALLLIACSFILATPSHARTLSFEDRVGAQRAIEQVYWSHRIWPAGNPGPKPPLSAVLSDAQIRARVDDYLEKSNALEMLWQRPITHDQLQAEMDRMGASTGAPEILQELFAALGNDPDVIAETLVRESLADGLIRESYARGATTSATAMLPKTSFDAWWAVRRGSTSIALTIPEGRYQPSSIATTGCTNDTWGASTSTSGSVPSARVEHVAVWTGVEMIVWGGSDLGSYLNTGGRYNPATDTWGAPPSTINAPLGRTEGSAVWTGTEMIVWGGFDAGGDLNTGGRYNPVADTWGTSTSTSGNVPSARHAHTAVWTGTEMIVWGGSDAGGFKDTGGRYNPASNTWGTPTSRGANVPSARSAHSAVWTGTEMIIWGGQQVNTGGRYNPATDTWGAATSTSGNVPSARYSHTAVWSGTEMIVWGGYDGADANTGGRYDPPSNTWGPATSTSGNVPSGREGVKGVWTGTEMIVWGGTHQGTVLNTGGRYCGCSSGGCALVGVSDPMPSTQSFAFAAPWPNPSARTIAFEFALPARAQVRAEVVDVAGRQMSPVLEDGVLDAGTHRLNWDGRDPSGNSVPPGVYLVRISAGTASVVHRIVIIR